MSETSEQEPVGPPSPEEIKGEIMARLEAATRRRVDLQNDLRVTAKQHANAVRREEKITEEIDSLLHDLFLAPLELSEVIWLSDGMQRWRDEILKGTEYEQVNE